MKVYIKNSNENICEFSRRNFFLLNTTNTAPLWKQNLGVVK